MTTQQSETNGNDSKNLSAIHLAVTSLQSKLETNKDITEDLIKTTQEAIDQLATKNETAEDTSGSAKQWIIKNITIKGCRGITDGPDLSFGKTGLLLFGENGTGKSSYVDGLEYAISARCKSLDKGDSGISWRKHGTHIKCESVTIKVTLTDGTNEAVIELDEEGNITADEMLKDIVKAAKERPYILRRWQVVEFIFAKPAERYEAVANFLSLDNYNTFEENLKEDLRASQLETKASKQEESAIQLAIKNMLGFQHQEPFDETICLEHINTTIATIELPQIKTLTELDEVLEKLKEQIKVAGGREAFTKIQKLKEAAAGLTSLAENPLNTSAAYLTARTAVIAEEKNTKGSFNSTVLSEAAEWISKDTLAECPVCEQGINPDIVIERIRTRIAARKKLTEMQVAQMKKREEFVACLTSWQNCLKQCLNAEITTVKQPVIDELATIIARHAKLTDEATLQTDLKKLHELQLDQIIALATKEIQQKQKVLFDPQKMTNLATTWRILSTTAENLNKLGITKKKTVACQKKEAEITAIVKLAAEARKEAVDIVLKEISKLANEYFNYINPDEELGELLVTTKPNQPKSLEIRSKFHEKTDDPRGYYSESHLDTLGLCFFLALRRKHFEQAPELAILVLDDVVHSIDAAHRQRIAKLLTEKFADHQLFITTHEKYWFEFLKIQRESKDFPAIRIAEWTIEHGPCWGDHRNDIEWLSDTDNKTKAPTERVARAGRALEQILCHLCDHLDFAVPFRLDGNYTIKPLWESFRSRAKKNNAYLETIEEHVKQIDELYTTRNWSGAHWKSWGEGLSAQEATRFVDAVIGLYQNSYCSNCQQFIRKIAQLNGVWSCKDECLKYSHTTTILTCLNNFEIKS